MDTDSAGNKDQTLLRRDIQRYCDVVVEGMKVRALTLLLRIAQQ